MLIASSRFIVPIGSGAPLASQDAAAAGWISPIPYAGHRYEIGAMAGAVQVFKNNKIKADRLAHDSETERRHKERRTKTIEEIEPPL